MPDVPETRHAAEQQPITRAQRRSERAAAPPPPATALRPLAIIATMAFAGLIALRASPTPCSSRSPSP